MHFSDILDFPGQVIVNRDFRRGKGIFMQGKKAACIWSRAGDVRVKRMGMLIIPLRCQKAVLAALRVFNRSFCGTF